MPDRWTSVPQNPADQIGSRAAAHVLRYLEMAASAEAGMLRAPVREPWTRSPQAWWDKGNPGSGQKSGEERAGDRRCGGGNRSKRTQGGPCPRDRLGVEEPWSQGRTLGGVRRSQGAEFCNLVSARSGVQADPPGAWAELHPYRIFLGFNTLLPGLLGLI